MNFVKVGGISINLDALESLDYDNLLARAMMAPKYFGYRNKKERIEAEFEKNGISRKTCGKSKVKKPSGKGRQTDSGKQGADIEQSTPAVEKGS